MNWIEWVGLALGLSWFGLLAYCRYLHQQIAGLRAILGAQQVQQQAIQDMQRELSEGMHELRVGSLGVGDKVKTLLGEVQALGARQQELAEMDPETKRYSHAVKLLQKGASVEELMEACELPRAEAEMLFSVHGKKGQDI